MLIVAYLLLYLMLYAQIYGDKTSECGRSVIRGMAFRAPIPSFVLLFQSLIILQPCLITTTYTFSWALESIRRSWELLIDGLTITRAF